LAHELGRARITFRVDTGSRPLPIRADRIQIEQVAVNLIQNAIDAVREVRGGRKEIHLKVRAAKGRAELSVSDTGGGVSAAASERLFEPFFTTKARGLGMGLAISRSIIEGHRGRIWAERPPGPDRGTIVRFSLPLRAPKAARKVHA
jgi:signal transduction histidine kinase